MARSRFSLVTSHRGGGHAYALAAGGFLATVETTILILQGPGKEL